MTSGERVLRILRRLTKRPTTLAQLVEMIGDRNPKTIRRDLDAIRRAGFFLIVDHTCPRYGTIYYRVR